MMDAIAQQEKVTEQQSGLSLPDEFRGLEDGLLRVQNIWYNEKTVHLDGYIFDGCRFDRCKLCFVSANFRLINCYIGEGTTINVGGDAVLPIRFFNYFANKEVSKAHPFFAPFQNLDGTITINSPTKG